MNAARCSGANPAKTLAVTGFGPIEFAGVASIAIEIVELNIQMPMLAKAAATIALTGAGLREYATSHHHLLLRAKKATDTR